MRYKLIFLGRRRLLYYYSAGLWKEWLLTGLPLLTGWLRFHLGGRPAGRSRSQRLLQLPNDDFCLLYDHHCHRVGRPLVSLSLSVAARKLLAENSRRRQQFSVKQTSKRLSFGGAADNNKRDACRPADWPSGSRDVN